MGGGVVPKEYIKPAEQGMKETCESGVIAGYPLIDVRCTLVHGSYHDVDSSEMAFKIAGSMAFKDGVKKCNPVLLDPGPGHFLDGIRQLRRSSSQCGRGHHFRESGQFLISKLLQIQPSIL